MPELYESFCDECPECEEEMTSSRSGDWYYCEECDKDYFHTDLITV